MDRSDIIDRMYIKAITYCPIKASINGLEGTGLIRELKDGYKNGVDYKLFVTQMPLRQGDIIEIDGIKYLARTLERGHTNKATICKAQSIVCGTYNQTLTNTTETLALVEGYLSQEITDNFNSILSDKIVFVIPEKNNSSIEINKYIQFKGDIYKIISIDKSIEGLYGVTAEYYTKGVKPSINVTPESIDFKVGDTQQLTIEVEVDGIKVDDPKVSYMYNNEIVSINGTLVTALKEGNTTITVTHEGVSDSVNVIVKAKGDIPGTTVYNIVGCPNDEMVVNKTETFTLEPSTDGITWRIDNTYSSDSGVAEIISQDTNSCVVKCLVGDDCFEIQAIKNGKVINANQRLILTSKR